MRKRNTIMLCVALIVVIAIVAVFLSSDLRKTPTDIIRQHFANESASFQLATVIEEIKIDNNYALVFYLKSNGAVSNAVLKKGLLGYRVIDYSGEVAPTSEVIPSGRFFSLISDSESIVWYVLYDQSITRVSVGDDEASIVNASNLRIYYSFGNYMTEPRCDFYAGNELVWTVESLSDERPSPSAREALEAFLGITLSDDASIDNYVHGWREHHENITTQCFRLEVLINNEEYTVLEQQIENAYGEARYIYDA